MTVCRNDAPRESVAIGWEGESCGGTELPCIFFTNGCCKKNIEETASCVMPLRGDQQRVIFRPRNKHWVISCGDKMPRALLHIDKSDIVNAISFTGLEFNNIEHRFLADLSWEAITAYQILKLPAETEY